MGCMFLWTLGASDSGTSVIHGRMLNIVVWCWIVRSVIRVSFDSHALVGALFLLLCSVFHWYISRKVI